jgi:hypothetical protein
MIERLTQAEYQALLRKDLTLFAARCFQDLNPQTDLAMNWHLRVIAAKLTAVYQGKIRRLIINMSHYIDFIEVIFHPTSFSGGPLRLSTAVGWNEQRGRAAMNLGLSAEQPESARPGRSPALQRGTGVSPLRRFLVRSAQVSITVR